MVLKVKRDVLEGFLSKSIMTGKQQIDECILDFQKDGLHINANSPAKQSRVMSWLKTSAFNTYEELGKVGVNDMNTIVKVLDRFDEDLTLKKEGNLLTVSGGVKKVDIELVSENFLLTDTGEPSLEFADVFNITAVKLKEIFKDVKMNEDAILIIETQPKKVLFKNTGKYKFTTETEALSCKGGVNVKFGDILIDALFNLDGNLECSVGKDYPIKVIEKTENSIVTIIAAPRVEGE